MNLNGHRRDPNCRQQPNAHFEPGRRQSSQLREVSRLFGNLTESTHPFFPSQRPFPASLPAVELPPQETVPLLCA